MSDATIAGAWEVTGYDDGTGAVAAPVPGSTITADFAADGGLSGGSGVNRFRAAYELIGDAGISIAAPAGTRMAGPPALMEQERLFLAALGSAVGVALQGDALTLRNASGAIAVTLTRA